jgi:hypothetical protein
MPGGGRPPGVGFPPGGGADPPRVVEAPKFLGIYRLEGGVWTICFDAQGKTRPREFKTKPDTHEEMYIFVHDPED